MFFVTDSDSDSRSHRFNTGNNKVVTGYVPHAVPSTVHPHYLMR